MSNRDNWQLQDLISVIESKKNIDIEDSYTSLLMRKGIDEILKKFGEESIELIIAAKNNARNDVIHEASDLLYHFFVLMNYLEISIEEIESELYDRSFRSGIAEKSSRKK